MLIGLIIISIAIFIIIVHSLIVVVEIVNMELKDSLISFLNYLYLLCKQGFIIINQNYMIIMIIMIIIMIIKIILLIVIVTIIIIFIIITITI